MKNPYIQSGMVTMELMIALVVMAVVVSGVVGLVFSAQTLAVDTDQSTDAVSIAQKLLDQSRVNARDNFDQVVGTTTVHSIYTVQELVSDLNRCEKLVTAHVSWKQSANRMGMVSPQTRLFGGRESQALGGDCGGEVAGEFSSSSPITNLGLPAGVSSTDIDIVGSAAFISASSTVATDPDIYIIDITDAAYPTVKYSLDTGPGINTLDAIAGTDGYYYIFAANREAQFQLQVIKIRITLASPPVLVAARTLPGVAGVYPAAVSICYYQGRIYLGTKRTIGHEFHVYDATNPSAPVWVGSKQMNHNINQIVVRDNIAYIAASGNSKDVMVMDVHDPAHMADLGSVDVPGSEDGKSIYIAGHFLYLGRFRSTSAARPELYMLDIRNPELGLPIVGSYFLRSTINDIASSGDLLFLATSDVGKQLHILRVTEAGSLVRIRTINLFSDATGIDTGTKSVFVSLASSSSAVSVR